MNTAELKKLQSEITQGEWKHVRQRECDDRHDVVEIGRPQGVIVATCGNQACDDGVIAANAAAIALVPQLIAQNIELIEENERLKEVLLELLKETNEHAAGFCPKLMEACKNAKAALGVKE